MPTTRIALHQMAIGNVKAENLETMIEDIKRSDADFLVYPEMALTGHHGGFSVSKTKLAWEQLETACRQHYKTVIFGTGATSGDDLTNQVRVIDSTGETIGKQNKLVPTKEEREWCTVGDSLQTFTTGGIIFGCLISNDFWVAPGHGPYPDNRLSCQLGEQGAQVIFVIANVDCDDAYTAYYEANLSLRARESKAHVVFVNAARPQMNSGYCASGVVGPHGDWLVRAENADDQILNFDYGK